MPQTNPAALSQQFPRLAASACVWRDGRVLLVKRAKPPHVWAFPGGHVGFGETAEAAALRELKEETGIAAQLEQLVGLYDIIRREPPLHYVIACFTGRWIAGEATAMSDASEARWLLPDETGKLILAPNISAAMLRAARILSI